MFNSNAGYRLPPFYNVTSNILVEGLTLNGAHKHLQYHTLVKWLLWGLVTATKPCTINCWRLGDSAKTLQNKNLCFQSIFKIKVEVPLNGHPKWTDLVVAYSWWLTRIKPQRVSSEKRSDHIYIMEDNSLHAISKLQCVYSYSCPGLLDTTFFARWKQRKVI